MANNIYITGATGRLGSAVLAKVDAIPLVRKKSDLKGEIITDFSVDELKKILVNASVIIHIAGSVNTIDKKDLWTSNVELTKKIVESVPKDCRIIFASSISVYGKILTELPTNEKTKTNPDSNYAKSKYEAEKIIASHANHVILRVGTIYGNRFEDYNRILSKLEEGEMRIIGSGGNRIPFVNVDDVADVFKAAIQNGGGVYVIAGDPLTQKKIYELAAKELKVNPPSERVDRRSVIILAAFGEILYRLGGKKPSLTREHVAVLAYDRIFDCTKARKELGFAPRPLEKGIREIVRNYKKKTKNSA